MPDATRCEWIDWRQVLESKLAERFGHLDCAGRRALGDSILWLARPRWSEPGNDLRTELDSRRVINALLEDSLLAPGTAVGR